jgi:hypothetical protein
VRPTAIISNTPKATAKRLAKQGQRQAGRRVVEALVALQRKLSPNLALDLAHTHSQKGRALSRGRGFYAVLPLQAPPNLALRT